MKSEPNGIMVFDVVGANLLPPRLRTDFMADVRWQIRTGVSPDVHVHTYGDALALVYPTCKSIPSSLRTLIDRWMDVRNPVVSPLAVGIRIGIHAGYDVATRLAELHEAAVTYPRKELRKFDAKILPPVDAAFRLAWAGSVDTVRLSTFAYQYMGAAFADEVGVASPRDFLLRPAVSGVAEIQVAGFEFPLATFFRGNQFRVQIAPSPDLIALLRKKPELIYEIPPRRFEEVVGELFAGLGFDVELTSQTRDQGIDIIALKRRSDGGFLERYLIQCKRYHRRRRVGVEVVYAMLGAGVIEPHTGLVIATTSYFTQPVMRLAASPAVQWRLHLKDYDAIAELITSYRVHDNE